MWTTENRHRYDRDMLRHRRELRIHPVTVALR
jgi:hypothetical protein